MKNRLSEFRRMLEKREVDAAIIVDELNIGYLCGFRFTDGYLYIDAARALLVTDFRYFEEANEKCFPGYEVVMPESRAALLKDVTRADGVKTVGFENNSMTVAQYNRFLGDVSAEFVPISDILLQMRSVKDPEEVEKIRAAQAIADEVFASVLPDLRPDMTETELALELEFRMRKKGASGCSFDTIAVSGAASALPHGTCRNLPLSRGFLTMDFGCILDGYCSDMTRTVVIGKATPEMKKLYQTVLSAQEAALAYIKAGTDGYSCDKVARDVIESAGYHGAFGHSLGHGVGLYIHESPSLAPSAKGKVLVPGNIVTVEPGIYLQGKYGCRIEDMGCVTETGFDNFTRSPKEMIEILF